MRLLIYILLTLILLTACNAKRNKEQFRHSHSYGVLIKNLESNSPTVWSANCDGLDWRGDYVTRIDSVFRIDPTTLNEVLVVYEKIIRFNKWILDDDEGNIYAEALYQDDSLISYKTFEGYRPDCDIDSICAFKEYCDTLSVTEFFK